MSQYTGVHVYQPRTGDIHAGFTILLQRGPYYIDDVDKERIYIRGVDPFEISTDRLFSQSRRFVSIQTSW